MAETVFTKRAKILSVLAILLVGGCAVPEAVNSPPAEEREIAALTREIDNLGDSVDPDEAARAARIAIEYSHQLAREYGVTDPPLIHNIKVNSGLRPRGLCYQWADDLEARLRREQFRTLDLHRAIANADNPFLIDHSTTIVSRRGDTLFQGIILDPWRNGGDLFWAPTLDDTRYHWVPRARVFEEKHRGRTSQVQGATGA